MTREVIERTILGNHVKVTVDLLEDRRARVIEYHRTRPGVSVVNSCGTCAG